MDAALKDHGSKGGGRQLSAGTGDIAILMRAATAEETTLLGLARNSAVRRRGSQRAPLLKGLFMIEAPARGFSDAEFAARTERAQARMAAEGLNGLLLMTKPELY